MKMTREFYIPKGYTKVISIKNTELYMLTNENDTYKYKACGFSGKKAKYDFWSNFKSIEDRQKYITEWENRIKAWNTRKQEIKDKRNVPNSLKAGDILYTSWGYEQTNIDFYEVLKVIGKMVEIVEIAQDRKYTGQMIGECSPLKGSYSKEPMRKLVKYGNQVKMASYATAWLWDGKPKTFTEYH